MVSHRGINKSGGIIHHQKPIDDIKLVKGSPIVPPNPPWIALNITKESGGYLSIYYSEDLSPLPIRWVTKLGDHKSDPNLETLTYGLFSICGPKMRSGVVNRNSEYLFFATARNGERVLSGYYHLGWYAQGVYKGKTDYCLAADRAHFIADPIPLKKVDRSCSTNVSKWFRNMRLLTNEQCRRIAGLIDAKPNAISAYLEEIDRLERFNLKHTGYRYPTWKRTEKFSWNQARELLSRGGFESLSEKVPNSSPSGLWQCLNCLGVVNNKALLKKCPDCGHIGTLRPQAQES